MARVYFWDRRIIEFPAAASTFVQMSLRDAIVGETLIRWRLQLYAEASGAFPVAGYPLIPIVFYFGMFDGPFSTWQSAHPSTPAESTYGWLGQYRPQWQSEEHAIESTRFIRWLAPKPELSLDLKAQRVVKNTGDGLLLEAWNVPGSSPGLNPAGFTLHGLSESLWYSAP